MIYEIRNSIGEKVKVIPKVELYAVKDFMGRDLPGLAIDLVNADNLEPYARLTVSLREFISWKNCAYIDTNNCSFANQLLKYGIAEDTGLKKRSGYCEYPLWVFKEEFLREHGAENYQKYREEYDNYMRPYMVSEDEEEELGGIEQ